MHDSATAELRRLRRLLETRLRPAAVTARVACATRAFPTPERHLGFPAATQGRFRPLATGEMWGAPFETWWMAITGTLPADFAGGRVELRVDLGFRGGGPGFQAEALARDARGRILKGIAPRNAWVALPATPGPVEVFLEAAANPTFSANEPESALLGDPATAGSRPLYAYGGAEIVRLDETATALVADLEVLGGLATALAPEDPWRAELVRGIGRALDALDPSDPLPGAPAARALLAPLLARPAVAGAHRVSATGHAHIDSAWLWPLEETRRKCARTLANVLALGEEYPELVFSFSQAQQLAWVREDEPELYAAVAAAVGDGRIVPVGGMWVESDTNVPGGESLARQLLYGQRFYAAEFGRTCTEVWLPDCFGYSPALPQLAVLAGARAFLTQKLSWNDTNRFPHHSFAWEGLDGTRIFTHFPPADTYNGELTPAELLAAQARFSDAARTARSLLPFGYGDGGGGPTREMLERARRLADLAGCPRVAIESPEAFFTAAIGEDPDPPVWVGELYLELHRGTFTSQAAIKALNRRCEHLLREAELWAATASLVAGVPYPYEVLESAWKTLLLRQFHDILPGSSIAMVNDEAVAALGRLAEELEALATTSLRSAAGTGTVPLVANARPLAAPAVPALAVAAADEPADAPVQARERPGGGYVLDNGLVRATCDAAGLIVSLVDLVAGRELVAPGERAGLLQLHPDLPAAWDAWDVDAAYRRVVTDLDEAEALELSSDDAGAAVLVRRRFGSSRVEQEIRLLPGERRVALGLSVDWRAVERFLKLAVPLDLATTEEVAEVAFGHVRRPTHENTSWDAARFERCAHRFVRLAEGDYGVALTNDATYGHDTARPARPGGGTTTTFRWSVLRAARFPDPRAEAGTHRFSFSIWPGVDLAGAIAAGYAENLPLRRLNGAGPVAPPVTLSNPAVLAEAVFLAHDRSGDLIVRLYESRGGRAATTLTTTTALAGVERADLLERPLGTVALEPDGHGVALTLRPFEVLTLRLRRA